jgi:hypothetical protein
MKKSTSSDDSTRHRWGLGKNKPRIVCLTGLNTAVPEQRRIDFSRFAGR